MLKEILQKGATLVAYAVVAYVLIVHAAHADIIYYIDVDPNTPGIQDVRTVAPNSDFSVDFLMELTGDTSLDAYRASVNFDSTGLTYQSAIAKPVVNYSEQVGTLAFSSQSIGPFEAASNSIGMGISAPFGPIVIGTLTFTTRNSTGQFRISPFEIPDLDGSFDNRFNPLTPVFHSGTISITAVPEPSIIAMLATAIMGVGSLRRLRKTRTRNFKKGQK